jgi:hypothetical protein
MYGLTRATATLLGAALAGFLLWLAVQVGGEEVDTAAEYWSVVGLLVAAGFVLPLSQLAGGWTKWGWPRISGQVFLIGFVPAALVTLWIVLADQPEDDEWLRGNILDWSDDIGLENFVADLRVITPILVFGVGVLFGFTLDTAGPRLPSTETVITAPPRSADETVVDEETRVSEAPPEDETRVQEPARPRREE